MQKKVRGELILQYMSEHKLSKTKFCKLCNISYSSLNKLLNNNLMVKSSTFIKVVETMKIRAQDLIGI